MLAVLCTLGVSAVKKSHRFPVTTLTDLRPQPTRQYPRSTPHTRRSAPERGLSKPGGLLTL
jgi:hypothetical protein